MLTSPFDPARRAEHLRWLFELTAIPTASGKEQRVIAWIRTWAAARPDLALHEDPAGNLILSRRDAPEPTPSSAPLFITAHLDHPAFVIESFIGPATLELSFRGGVHTPYFTNAPITLFTAHDEPIHATIISTQAKEPWRTCLAELEDPRNASRLALGDIGRWHAPEPSLTPDEQGLEIVHTHACDDLAAAAAALAAFDVLRDEPRAAHVRLLFTRAEEVGFIGAIAACKHRTIPEGSRLIALENSRAFPEDSPIGGGPIVRVGDRLSTFSPTLTAACAKAAEDLSKSRASSAEPFRWQRKLMPGGACEATCFQSFGYESTCLCLPLGNYHNMADLTRVQANDPAAVAAARCAHEYIARRDYEGMIDLLIALGTNLAAAEPIQHRMEKLYAERAHVLTS